MSSARPAIAAASARGVPNRAWFDGFGMRHLGIVLCFSLVVSLSGAVYGLLVHSKLDPSSMLANAIFCAAVGLCAMLSAAAVENRLGGILGRPVRVITAVLAAAIAGAASTEAVIFLVIKPLGLPVEDAEFALHASLAHRLAFDFAGAATWSLVLVTLYSMFEADRHATAELHAVNVAAFAAERNLIEGNLRAMQTRVDPGLLFDTLLEVDRAYARSVRSGEEALDTLIGYLRAVLPVDVSGTSTVTRELELVGAYLALRALKSQARRDDRINVDPAAGDAQMPAMLLLPLVRWAIEPSGAARLKVAVRRGAAMLEVAVGSEGLFGGRSPAHDIEGVCERFRHLYGERGRIRVNVEPHARQADMEIPL